MGLPVFLGSDRTTGRVLSQIPGFALRMRSRAFRELVGHAGPLHHMIQLYAQALFTLLAQSSACNRVHDVEERCARWLLLCHDRVYSDRIALTQDFLAQMLGVRRATVSDVARALQRRGLIEYSRGVIDVLDRPGLEAASCECYGVIRDEFERLLASEPASSQRGRTHRLPKRSPRR